jgi:predicted transcriptional regulator of viral defense system
VVHICNTVCPLLHIPHTPFMGVFAYLGVAKRYRLFVLDESRRSVDFPASCTILKKSLRVVRMGTTQESERNIRSIASLQQGYFTARQACEAGYSYPAQYYQREAGNWVREAYGVYRIADYTAADRPDLVLWSLWSRDRKGKMQGVFSHETALSIYELSDVMPARLHMTVPLSFRKSAKTPGVLVIHRETLELADIEVMEGYSVTRPLRTIIDAAASISSDLLEQAVRQALQRGLVHRGDLTRASRLDAGSPLAEIMRSILPR